VLAHQTQTPFPHVREWIMKMLVSQTPITHMHDCAAVHSRMCGNARLTWKVANTSIPAHAGMNMCEIRYTLPHMREESFGTHNISTKYHTHSRICGIVCLFLTHSPSASLFLLTDPFFVPCQFFSHKISNFMGFDPLLMGDVFCF
jgi:hypothetical protein